MHTSYYLSVWYWEGLGQDLKVGIEDNVKEVI